MPDFDLNQAYSSFSEPLENLKVNGCIIYLVPVGLFPPSMQIRDDEEEENNPDWVKTNEARTLLRLDMSWCRTCVASDTD